MFDGKEFEWDESSENSMRKWKVAMIKAMLPDLVFPVPVIDFTEEEEQKQKKKSGKKNKKNKKI